MVRLYYFVYRDAYPMVYSYKVEYKLIQLYFKYNILTNLYKCSANSWQFKCLHGKCIFIIEISCHSCLSKFRPQNRIWSNLGACIPEPQDCNFPNCLRQPLQNIFQHLYRFYIFGYFRTSLPFDSSHCSSLRYDR